MHPATFLLTLFASVPSVLGLAIGDVRVGATGGNFHPVRDADLERPGVTRDEKTSTKLLAKRFVASFVNTSQDTTECSTTSTPRQGRDTTPINVSDCKLIGEWAASLHGYWEMSDWYYNPGPPIISVGTCAVQMLRNDGLDWNAR
jgi:hypothetical protein